MLQSDNALTQVRITKMLEDQGIKKSQQDNLKIVKEYKCHQEKANFDSNCEKLNECTKLDGTIRNWNGEYSLK